MENPIAYQTSLEKHAQQLAVLEEEYESEKDAHLQANDATAVTSQNIDVTVSCSPASDTQTANSANVTSSKSNSLSVVNPLASLTRKGSLILSRKSVLTSSFRSRNSSGDSMTSATRTAPNLVKQDSGGSLQTTGASAAGARVNSAGNSVENGVAMKSSKLNGKTGKLRSEINFLTIKT